MKQSNKLPLNIKEIKNYIGKDLGTSDWFLVSQKKIKAFAESTQDFQWIHLDEERAKKESPFKTTIAHGYFTLSLLPMFVDQILEYKNVKRSINYGANKIRFLSPVLSESHIRAKLHLMSADDFKGGLRLTNNVEIQIKDEERPAMVAETLSVVYPIL